MSQRRIAGPVNRTIAHKALKELLAAGGSMSSSILMRALPERYRSSSRFTAIVIDPLALHALAYEINGVMEITAKGRKFLKLGEHVDRPDSEIPENIASYRTAPAFKPLDIAKIMAKASVRPGMNDYTLVPSLAGSTRRPYKGNRE